ncbi:MAG: outer membrane protein transport protein [Candidatus Marinimicrobia bacterium]|nr:outer membrane protein transport protein [Candidatus Neomarinimicrobiota bacterium]MCF7829069.1 outer membrane protein transport protein [Candidatus Neomarinimicrobiota bacterium]MCF7881794.1 outer membrane protein transport protein [Candidatus Neomarinimicrobiota bacterium]
MKNLRTTITAIAVIGMIITPGIGSAQSYFSLILPQEFGPETAGYVSQGATGVANSVGYVNLWTNPAALVAGEANYNVSVSSTLRRFTEDRSFPAVDLFEDKVTDNMYASNGRWYPGYAGGAVANFGGFSVASSYTPVWDMRYNYREEVRSSLGSGVYNRDPVAGYHNIDRNGQIYAASLGGNVSLVEKLSVGVAYHLLMADDLSNEYSVNVLREDDPALSAASDTAFASDIGLDGTPGLLTAGLAYDINWRFRVGLNYRSGVTLTQTGLASVPGFLNRVALPEYERSAELQTIETQIPGKIALGIRGKMQNPIATSAQVEVHYTDWSNYQVTYVGAPDSANTMPENFQETLEYHLGVEHLLLGKIPFRFGFIYAESPLGREFEQTKFTIGGSYLWGNVTLDFGAIFNSVTYDYVDIFPADAETGTTLESVNESNVRATFTLSYAL